MYEKRKRKRDGQRVCVMYEKTKMDRNNKDIIKHTENEGLKTF